MRLRYFLFFVVFLPSITIGQTTSISPYSGFGLGELAPQGYDYSFAMGGVGIGFNDSLSLNPMNPASYSFFKRHNPIFQLGYKAQVMNIASEVNEQQLTNGTINNIGLGFKLNNKIGWAFGFNPATTVGYKIISADTLIDGNGQAVPIKYQFEGDGGYSKIFTGLAYEIFEKKDSVLGHLSSLSVGVNVNLFTGNKRTLYEIIYESNDLSYYNTRYEDSQIITAFGFDFGVQYQTFLKKESPYKYVNLSVGLTFNIPKNLNTKWETNYFTYVLDAVDQIVPQDTVFFSDSLKGETFIPLRLGIGMMLDINNQWQIGVDFEKQNWDDFKQVIQTNAGEISVPNTQLTDAWRIAVGLQYTITPISQRKLNTNYLKTITFRLGGRYSDNYLKFGDYQLTDQAVSVGFNFPLSKSQSYSSINFGMEIGRQGTTENGLIRQEYANFMLGIILLPHRFNKWFVKRKYN